MTHQDSPISEFIIRRSCEKRLKILITRGRFWWQTRTVREIADTGSQRTVTVGVRTRNPRAVIVLNFWLSWDCPVCGALVPTLTVQSYCYGLSQNCVWNWKFFMSEKIPKVYKNALVEISIFLLKIHFKFGSTYKLTFVHRMGTVKVCWTFMTFDLEASGFLFQLLVKKTSSSKTDAFLWRHKGKFSV